jgi:hypothetical protein
MLCLSGGKLGLVGRVTKSTRAWVPANNYKARVLTTLPEFGKEHKMEKKTGLKEGKMRPGKDRPKSYFVEYYHKNREKLNSYTREYQKQPEFREYRKKYVHANRDSLLVYSREYRKKTQKNSVYQRTWLTKRRVALGLPPPRKFLSWKSVESARFFLETVANLFLIQKWPDDWYRVSLKQIRQAGGMFKHPAM